MKPLKRIWACSLLLFISTLTLPGLAETVCSVHDGDTFTTCDGLKVRVSGIDAPEITQPVGTEAKFYLEMLTQGKNISLSCKGRSYKRQVCHVGIPMASGDTLDLGREMVGRGFAYDSPKYSKGEYSQAEAFAKREHRGVWVTPDGGERPWDYRRGMRAK